MYLLSNMAILGSYVRFQGCNHWFPLIRPYFFGGSEVLLDSHDKKNICFYPNPPWKCIPLKSHDIFQQSPLDLHHLQNFPRDLCIVWCKKLGLEVKVGSFVKYIPGTQMTLLFGFEKGLVLRGGPSKIEVIWVPGRFGRWVVGSNEIATPKKIENKQIVLCPNASNEIEISTCILQTKKNKFKTCMCR